MDEFEGRLDEFSGLMLDLMAQNLQSNKQMSELKAKWPEAFMERDRIDRPTASSSVDFMVGYIGWQTYKLFGMDYYLLHRAYNCLCEVLTWPSTSQREKDHRQEASLAFITMITSLDSQMIILQEMLNILKQAGFPASLFGAPE